MIAEEEEARGAKGVESRGRSPVIGGGRRRWIWAPCPLE